MEMFIANIKSYLATLISSGALFNVVGFILLVTALMIFFRILEAVTKKLAAKHFSEQAQHITSKLIHYSGMLVVVMTVFNRFGIDFSGLLGAAGIAGVAIGFAAQTSVSNIISGFFVMSERSFKMGDVIQVDTVVGTVVSIDLLAVRLKTAENQLVRIPNETIIKTNLKNITHYPLRRFTLNVSVSYSSDLEKVRNVLIDIAEKNAFAVKDPAPVIIFDSLSASSIDILFGVWSFTKDFLSLKNSILIEVVNRFREESITIPFPQLEINSR